MREIAAHQLNMSNICLRYHSRHVTDCLCLYRKENSLWEFYLRSPSASRQEYYDLFG